MKKYLPSFLLSLTILVLGGVLIGFLVSFSVLQILDIFEVPWRFGIAPQHVYAVFVAFHIIRGIGKADFEIFQNTDKVVHTDFYKKTGSLVINRAIQIVIALGSAYIMRIAFELLGPL